MILVTVGTHEQPFDRLVKYMDELRASGRLDEDVIIQTGYSTYRPTHCEWSAFYPYREMTELVRDARIVITHGGPSSFMMALSLGKIPIVVPRQRKYDEHVNDHQVDFCRQVAERQGNIIVVLDIDELQEMIADYALVTAAIPVKVADHNKAFNEELASIADELIASAAHRRTT